MSGLFSELSLIVHNLCCERLIHFGNCKYINQCCKRSFCRWLPAGGPAADVHWPQHAISVESRRLQSARGRTGYGGH